MVVQTDALSTRKQKGLNFAQFVYLLVVSKRKCSVVQGILLQDPLHTLEKIPQSIKQALGVGHLYLGPRAINALQKNSITQSVK
jgi:hypothetical protein